MELIYKDVCFLFFLEWVEVLWRKVKVKFVKDNMYVDVWFFNKNWSEIEFRCNVGQFFEVYFFFNGEEIG